MPIMDIIDIHTKADPMGEIGKVTAVKGDTVEVRIPQSDRCRGCRACQFITDQNQMQLYALNECQAKPGDNVEIEVAKSGELSSTLLVYGIPLAAFLLSLLILDRLLPELYTLLVSVAVTLLSYLPVHILSKKLDRTPYMPRAVRKF